MKPKRTMKLQTRLITFCRAFTRVELIVVLATLALLASVVLPGLASQRNRFERVACVNNLRMIGQAFLVWGSEHGGNTPWWLVSADGGTRGHPLAPNPWFQFSWISNQLGSPKLLVCPAEQNKLIATNWANVPGGFLSISYRNNALSYLVGLHARSNSPTAILSGDRNLRFDGFGSCATGLNNVWQFNPRSTFNGWTNSIHEFSGNLLLNDGSVLQTTTGGFRTALSNATNYATTHALLP